MPWYSTFSDLLKKKVCRYLLQRYLGQFLEKKLNLEQLNVDLYNGKGTIYDVSLDCESLNELCANQGWGIEVIGGHIGAITVTVPWNALLTDDSHVEIEELSISIKPLARHRSGASLIESMWSSMSSSMKLAQDCLNIQEEDVQMNSENTTIEGLEKFAQTIDNVLNRVKAKFNNTEIRLEYLLPEIQRGIALIMKIKLLEYSNEACSDMPNTNIENENSNSDVKTKKLQLISAYVLHHISIDEITFYTEEFRIFEQIHNIKAEHTVTTPQFYSTISQLPETDQVLITEALNHTKYVENTQENDVCHTEKTMFSKLNGRQDIRIKIKQSENVYGTKVDLELTFSPVFVFISPRQLHLIIAFCDTFSTKKPEFKKESQFTEELQDQISKHRFNYMSGVLSQEGAWSNLIEDSRQLQQENNPIKMKSFHYPESVESSMKSSFTCSPILENVVYFDTNFEISTFNLRIVSVNAVLLHEDIIFESSLSSKSPLSDESVCELNTLAKIFFDETENAKKTNYVCQKNHLRLHLAPIIIEGDEQNMNNTNIMKFALSIANINFDEVILGVTNPLITFHRPEGNLCSIPSRPDFHLKYQQKTSERRTYKHKRYGSRTELHILLEQCLIDFDISLYDRLNAILNTSPFLTDFKEIHPSSKHTELINEISVQSSSIEIRLRFPIIDLRPLHDPNRIPWWKKNIRADFLSFILIQFELKYSGRLIDILAKEIDIFYTENSKSQKIHLAKILSMDPGNPKCDEVNIEHPKISINLPTDKTICNLLKCSKEDSDSGETSGEGSSMYCKKPQGLSPFSSKRVCRESDTPHPKEDLDSCESIIIPGDIDEMKKFYERTMKTSKVQVKLFLPYISVQINSKHMYEVLYNRITTDLLMWSPSVFSRRKIKQANIKVEPNLLGNSMMDSLYIPSGNLINDDYESSSSNEETTDYDSDNVYFSTYDYQYNKKNQSSFLPAATSVSLQINISEGILTLYSPVRGYDGNVIPGQLGEFILTFKSIDLLSASGFNGNNNLCYVCLQGNNVEVYHCGIIPLSNLVYSLRLSKKDLPDYLLPTIYSKLDNSTLSNLSGSPKREMLSLVVQITTIPEQRIKRVRFTTGIQNGTLKHNPALSPYIWLNQFIDMFDIIDYPVEGYVPYGVMTEMQLHLWDCCIDYRPLHFPYRAVLDLGTFMIYSNLTTAIWGCNLRFVAEECALCLAPYEPKDDGLSNNIIALSSENLVSVLDIGLLELSLRLNEKATSKHPKFDLRASIQDVHIRTCSDSGRALAQLISYIAIDGDLNSNEDEKSDLNQSNLKDQTANEIFSVETVSNSSQISSQQQERVNIMMADALQESLHLISESDEDEIICDKGVEVFFFPDETNHMKKMKRVKNSEENLVKSPDHLLSRAQSMYELKTNTLSEDFTFGDTMSYHKRRESECSDEMRELLNYENTVLTTSFAPEDEMLEALPEVKKELGVLPNKPASILSNKNSSDLDEDFCIIVNEEKLSGLTDVEISGDPIRIVDNHFSVPNTKFDLLRAPDGFPMAVMRYTLCEMTLIWHMYGGIDFSDRGEKKSQQNKKEELKRPNTSMTDAYKHGVSYSKGYSGVKFGRKEIPNISWKVRGGALRNHDVLVEMHISKARLSHEVYPKCSAQASRQVLLITEFEIRDRLKSSEINKFLYHPSKKHLPKKSSQHMIVLKALHIRPNPVLPTQECCLRISMLPLRVNIDQDTLLFLVQFCNELGNGSTVKKETVSQKNTSLHQSPVMMVNEIPDALKDIEARKMLSENLMLLIEEEKGQEDDIPEPKSNVDNNTPIYFREIVFSPEVLIRLDYHGRRVELSRGPVAGLLMGLGQLQCSEIRLKKIFYKHGILGMERLLNFLFQEWLQDIKRNQLPAILSGVGPMYTLLQLFQGIRDLFWLPIEQYQKDGRIVRGLQLGAQSFTARTALAALEITAKLIQLLQFTAETAYDMVSPGPSVKRGRYIRKGKRKRTQRPQDIREGVANAYQIVKEGINETANTLMETTAIEHDQKGYTGAVGAVFRQLPPMAVRPIVLATQATNNVLGGVRNQLIPDARMEAKEKWKDDDD